jgi:hypothetical protein
MRETFANRAGGRAPDTFPDGAGDVRPYLPGRAGIYGG